MPANTSFPGNSNITFSNADDIDNWFTKLKGQDFVSWFNANVAKQGFWGKSGSRAALAIANDSQAHQRFDSLWSNGTINAMFDTGSITLMQFLCLQSIMINETGGQLQPLTERVGNAGHPGIAYAFDKIPNLKRSYNTLAGNKTCFQLFNDKNYNTNFSSLPLAGQLKNTTNQLWNGEAYPAGVSTSTNPLQTGYVLEADFFKFRGRGFIQTTGRANYKKLVDYVISYKGTCETIVTTKTKWQQLSSDADLLATVSSNTDWDNLFQKGDCLVAGRAVNIHNMASGNYLGKIAAATMANLNAAILNMGLRISGSQAYASLFQNRVMQIVNALK